MALETNYIAVLNADSSILSIVDASTPNYDGESIVSRTITLVTAGGEIQDYPFPIVGGVGDSFHFDIEKDLAITVELSLEVISESPDSNYFRSKNLLVAPKLLDCITSLRQDLIHLYCDKCNYSKQLEELELIDSFYNGAGFLISTDIVGAQEALDRGNSLCKNKCN